jgi:hypothetical protein
MKEKINSQSSQNGSATRIPLNPQTRIPFNPLVRIPFNPLVRMVGSSSQFFENFTAFKNTESRWDIKGFSKDIGEN